MRTDAPKGTQILKLTPVKVQEIWSRLQNIHGLFDDFASGRPDIFLRGLLDPNTLWLELEDGNGLLYATELMVGLSAQVHFVYWDRKLASRRQFTLDCLDWLMTRCDLTKVNAVIPDFCKAAIHFARKLGFKQEGCIRRYSLNEGRLYDAIWLGITREEVTDGCKLLVDGNAEERTSELPVQRYPEQVVRPEQQLLS